jgi:hypothetical protein
MAVDYRAIETQLNSATGFSKYVTGPFVDGIFVDGAFVDGATRASYEVWRLADERAVAAAHLVYYLEATPPKTGGYQVVVWRDGTVGADELMRMRRFIAEISSRLIINDSSDVPQALDETTPDKLATDMLFKAAFGPDVHARVFTVANADEGAGAGVGAYEVVIYARRGEREYCLPIPGSKSLLQKTVAVSESA